MTLCTPSTATVFAAGTSSYGVSDLTLLAEDTHKFESQYLFKLVGGTPTEVPEIYAARSAVKHADQIRSPLLVGFVSLRKINRNSRNKKTGTCRFFKVPTIRSCRRTRPRRSCSRSKLIMVRLSMSYSKEKVTAGGKRKMSRKLWRRSVAFMRRYC